MTVRQQESQAGDTAPEELDRLISAAVKAQMIYANYLEKSDKAKLALLEEAAGWAEARRDEAPKLANAHYFYAYALGRYSQGISITKALAQGFGGKVKDALTTATHCRVAVSVTTLDRALARSMEPRVATPEKRIGAIKAL